MINKLSSHEELEQMEGIHTWSTSTSSQTINASFPPSSSVTGISVSAAFLIIWIKKMKHMLDEKKVFQFHGNWIPS